MRRRSRIWSNGSKSKIVEKNKGLWILAIYFFLSIYLLPMFPHGSSPNELTRWATVVSLVEKSSFEISWIEDLIGKKTDTTRIDDKSYSNKAPGTAVLAAPFYALTRLFIGPPNASNIRVSWFVMRLFLSTLPLVLLGFWLYSRDSDEISLAALLFATPLFVGSLLFFSHVLVAVLLYFTFRLLYDTERIFLRNCLAAGFLSGLAVTCELMALVPVLIFAVGLFFADKRNESRWQNVFVFALGSAPFAILLLIYNYAVFGSPFAFPYAFEAFPEMTEMAGQDVFGPGFPTFSNIYRLLFSPSRGLFFFAPLLFLPVVAFFTSRERKTWRHRVKVAAILVSLLVIGGHGAAHGGWAFGARYLIFILPLMLDSFFDGEIFEFSNVWQGFLFTISFVLCTIPALTFPFAPPEFGYPHNNFWSKLLFYENWFTPNLANVFGLSSDVWTLFPVLALLVVVLFILRRYARRPERFTIGIFAGLIVVGVYLVLPNLDTEENALRRATIAESHYKPGGRLEIFKAAADPQIPPRLKEIERRIVETRAFAPNDFPYLTDPALSSLPAERQRILDLQKSGMDAEAELALQKAKESFPQLRCEFARELASLYNTTGRKELAVRELESVQEMIAPTASAECVLAQYYLGSLYQEQGQIERAEQTFQKFLANTNNSNDIQIQLHRQRLGAK
jgi:hypothetical protein